MTPVESFILVLISYEDIPLSTVQKAVYRAIGKHGFPKPREDVLLSKWVAQYAAMIQEEGEE